MSRSATFEAEVSTYYLASDAARLASLIAGVDRKKSNIYAESARKTIKAMRDDLNRIEGILEAEDENSGDRNKNRENGNV